ncbi:MULTISPECIES: TauD/TfdA dioxygenase family protein [Acinetobacter]|uniref:TauD/TfdA family dioxygenase n=1 Tax=Acinetobacter corruptisaponis TaxID=3045147 RepID=A0ABY8S318_9GAMM|nr:TauD/TfdA family dioxygenase [Acinetobacter sp. KCTC 92772]WHP05463.1 TauD/TfdA family dioxygenase [Acinetobacter sp. KCTC 92772]
MSQLDITSQKKPKYDYQHIQVKPVTGRIGAEISGVALSAALDQDVVNEINQALLDYKVVFFRGQQHLDDLGQEAFARLLGEPLNHPSVPIKGGTKHTLAIDSRDGRASSWHTDITFLPNYPKYTILKNVVAPDVGGDTVWANTTAAYEDLTPELKTLAESLRAVHTNVYDYANKAASAAESEGRKLFTTAVEIETEHPLVRVHPETGEKTLVLGHFFKQFSGLNNEDSRLLFTLFQNHIVRWENVVRWRWAAGDVAIWDNRATQHRAIDDYGSELRIASRVTLEGDIPVGVDGRPSKIIKNVVNQDISELRKDEGRIYKKVS